MKRNKKYIKPSITVEPMIVFNNVLCSSLTGYNMDEICGPDCKLWHTCRDRQRNHVCRDKQNS